MNKKVLYIVVNYFNEEEVAAFVKDQLQNQQQVDIQIWIADNGSKNNDVLKAIEIPGNIVTINCVLNKGYFGAANYVINKFLEKNKMPDFVIVSNVDLIFGTSTDVLKLTETPDADVVGPCLYSYSTHKTLNPFSEKRISKSSLIKLKMIFSFYPLYLFYQFCSIIKNKFAGIDFSSDTKNEKRKVYALHGSMLVFSKSYFEKGGDLNYGGFLFGEELFVAETALQRNCSMMYVPSVTIAHIEHSTTGIYKRPELVKWMRDAVTYILKTFFNE